MCTNIIPPIFPLITFIIPTIGRDTLINSINSLLNLDDNDWNAIVIFDGIDKIDLLNDPRIKSIKIEKHGKEEFKNNAGLVRNIGFNYVKTEWIGFLDDDDYLSPDYISCLKNEIKMNSNIDLCLFRMGFENGCILPSKFDKNIIRNKAGISFALKTKITEKIKFINSPFEDYIFLKEVQNNKYKIVISSYVCYFVRTKPYKCELYPKLVL